MFMEVVIGLSLILVASFCVPAEVWFASNFEPRALLMMLLYKGSVQIMKLAVTIVPGLLFTAYSKCQATIMQRVILHFSIHTFLRLCLIIHSP